MIEYRIPLGKNKGLLKINMTKVLKQFFTPQKYSQIMIENLNITSPKKIIDLSMGEGSLLIEAMRLWENSKYIGNDIDIDCCNNIKKEYHDKIICFNENIFEKTPKIKAIHAGLECGIFAGKISDLDVISIGPNIYGAHTPEERMEISSVEYTWKWILKALELYRIK